MNLKDIMAISAMPGLYEMVTNRGDGLVVKSLATEKVQFVPNRTHTFSPLENITVYTKTDSKELKEIFAEMKKQEKENPVCEFKNDEELKAFFKSIVPDYDEEKVYTSHMKKIISWFGELDKHERLTPEETKEEKVETDSETKSE